MKGSRFYVDLLIFNISLIQFQRASLLMDVVILSQISSQTYEKQKVKIGKDKKKAKIMGGRSQFQSISSLVTVKKIYQKENKIRKPFYINTYVFCILTNKPKDHVSLYQMHIVMGNLNKKIIPHSTIDSKKRVSIKIGIILLQLFIVRF